MRKRKTRRPSPDWICICESCGVKIIHRNGWHESTVLPSLLSIDITTTHWKIVMLNVTLPYYHQTVKFLVRPKMSNNNMSIVIFTVTFAIHIHAKRTNDEKWTFDMVSCASPFVKYVCKCVWVFVTRLREQHSYRKTLGACTKQRNKLHESHTHTHTFIHTSQVGDFKAV